MLPQSPKISNLMARRRNNGGATGDKHSDPLLYLVHLPRAALRHVSWRPEGRPYEVIMMPAQMSKTERVTAALNGRAADRPPVSAWWHDYKREWSAADLAEATLEYYRKYGWDYIKVNPRFSYYAEDWGATYRRYQDRMPEIDHPAVSSPEDLRRLQA